MAGRSIQSFPPQGVSTPTLSSLGATLANVLVEGNTTGGTDLDVSTGDTIAGVVELALQSDAGDVTIDPSTGNTVLVTAAGETSILKTIAGSGASAAGDLLIVTGAGGTTSGSGVLDVQTGQGGSESVSTGTAQFHSGDAAATNGATGDVNVFSGDSTGSSNSGDVNISPGAAPGAGVPGNLTLGTGAIGGLATVSTLDGTTVNVGTTAATAVNIGRSGVTTTVNGTLSAPSTGANSEHLGATSSATGDNSTAVGYGATANTTTTEDQLTALGASAVASGDAATAVGYSADATGSQGVAVGVNAQAGAGATSLGGSSSAAGANSFAGGQASSAGHAGAICIGQAATSTAANQAVFGSAGVPLTEFQTGTGANAQYLSIKQYSELVATTSGATVTTSGAIPAGATVLHVSCRVTTAVTTSSATNTFDVGDASDPNNWGSAIAGAQNTTTDHGDYTAAPAGTWSSSAREVILDAAGAETFTAGAVRVTVWFTVPSPAGS